MKYRLHSAVALVALLASCSSLPKKQGSSSEDSVVHVYKTANDIPAEIRYVAVGEIRSYGTLEKVKREVKKLRGNAVILRGRHGNLTAVRFTNQQRARPSLDESPDEGIWVTYGTPGRR